MKTNNQNICENCGLLKSQHQKGSKWLDKKKGEVWKPCKKFKPKTSK